jgi:hypothetical protein
MVRVAQTENISAIMKAVIMFPTLKGGSSPNSVIIQLIVAQLV